uniref:Reverse transcriptase RNase H-like domain-containing protein n=1 Tax=Octopus bimaculoides TaxID=37653 RepID=A0A0L8IH52_OCTBM
MKMTVANNIPIDIIDALILRISETAPSSAKCTTCQIVYITPSSDKISLSKQACVTLRMISPYFPMIGESCGNVGTPLESSPATVTQNVCSCPLRQTPSPTSPPFPATEENRGCLEKWLLELYSSSIFNICEHQQLSKISGPPIRLMVDPDAKPVTHHTPIPGPTHHTQSPFHQASSVPHHTQKTVFTAWNDYHSIALDERNFHLTTFIMPWSCFHYCIAPQGYIASGDSYSRQFDEIISSIHRKMKCINDTLMSFRLSNGIILNPTNFDFAPNYHQICWNITDICSWFRLINQVSYEFASAKRMLLFQELFKPGTQFVSTDQLNRLFEESKSITIKKIQSGVEIFNKTKLACLVTDWSKDSIGFWLFLNHCVCLPPTPFAANLAGKSLWLEATSASESHYTPVVGEALAVTIAFPKACYFTLGCANLIVTVDHKPLESARHAAADAVSCYPVGQLTPPDLPDDVVAMTHPTELLSHPSLPHSFLATIHSIRGDNTITCSHNDYISPVTKIVQSGTWDMIRTANTSDPSMTKFMDAIKDSFPEDHSKVPPELR